RRARDPLPGCGSPARRRRTSSSARGPSRAAGRDRGQPVGSWSTLLDRDAPVDAVFLGWIVARRLVVRAAVVPDDDVALAPAVAVLALRLDHAVGQLVDKSVSIVGLGSLDYQNLAWIEV